MLTENELLHIGEGAEFAVFAVDEGLELPLFHFEGEALEDVEVVVFLIIVLRRLHHLILISHNMQSLNLLVVIVIKHIPRPSPINVEGELHILEVAEVLNKFRHLVRPPIVEIDEDVLNLVLNILLDQVVLKLLAVKYHEIVDNPLGSDLAQSLVGILERHTFGICEAVVNKHNTGGKLDQVLKVVDIDELLLAHEDFEYPFLGQESFLILLIDQ